jgi:ABC-type sugar transport system permease subunit/ABC-type glycerol-3-phosphate transport system substrate-binding protein
MDFIKLLQKLRRANLIGASAVSRFRPTVRKKHFVFLILLVLICLCPLLRADATPIKLTVWGMESNAESKDLDAEVAAFEVQHPGVTVIMLSMGAGAMNPQKLMTAIVGGVPPDLVLQGRFVIGDWASRGAFRPLDDLLQSDARSSDPLAIRKANFIPATWAEAQYQGKVYAIPNDNDDRLLYYNRTLFKKAGLDPNNPPHTWEQMIVDAKKLTLHDASGNLEQLGIDPLYGQGWLYLWSWQEDGDFMSADGRRCIIDNAHTVKALTALGSWYDQLGGIDSINSFADGFGSGVEDPFLSGRLAMEVERDSMLTNIARYKPNLDFGAVPVPVPRERYDHVGRFRNESTWVTWSGGYSLAIPRGARHVGLAWDFIRWMTSPQSALIGAKAQATYVHEKGYAYVPYQYANIKVNDALLAAYKNTLPPRIRSAKVLTLKLLADTRYRPVTFVGQLLWDEQVRAVDSALRHDQTPEAALATAQHNVQAALDIDFTTDQHPKLPMLPVVLSIGALALGLLIFASSSFLRWQRGQTIATKSEARTAYLFAFPWIFGFLIFTLGPILASLVLSFCDYDVLHPARWAGLANYTALGTTDRVLVLKSLGNAAYLAIIGIPLGMATGLAMAMLLNSKVRGLKFYRTAFYIPSIVPVIATSVLWGYLLNADPHRGLINAFWFATLTHWFHIPPPGWEAVPQWSKPGLILMGLWGAGGGMILWLAGLQGIPSTLYEAASLDGAGSWAQFVHVTLPMLSPYIFFNVIMGTIGALQTFESAYVLGGTGSGGSTGPDDSLLVPVVYLFNNAFEYFKMGYASALAWLLFILILGLTLGQLKLAPLWVHYETNTK